MNLLKIIKSITIFEWVLWSVSSLILIIISIIFKSDILSTIASLLGVLSLILIAKGLPLGQFIIVIFSLIYGFISLKNRLYGEMITYVFMSLPSAIITGISWIKHPFKKGEGEIKIENLSKDKIIKTLNFSILITFIFFPILKVLNTANLIVSTLSIFTSMFAVILLIYRSPYYAIGYAFNDMVLIILWTLSTINNFENLPMILCFTIFLINDIYGFISWLKIRKKQINSSKEY